MDNRSWTTVASGPLPKAGSNAKASNSQGSAMAAKVAVEHAASTDKPTENGFHSFNLRIVDERVETVHREVQALTTQLSGPLR